MLRIVMVGFVGLVAHNADPRVNADAPLVCGVDRFLQNVAVSASEKIFILSFKISELAAGALDEKINVGDALCGTS